MDENSIRDDVTKNNCEKNVDQNQLRENNFHKIFWDGSINVIFIFKRCSERFQFLAYARAGAPRTFFNRRSPVRCSMHQKTNWC